MDYTIVLLRLLHIIAGVAWVGLAAVLALFVVPTVLKTGESGMRFLRSLLTNTSLLLPILSVLTVIPGALLYIVGDAASRFSSTGNIVLGMGAVAGILAGIQGGAVTRRMMAVLKNELMQHIPDEVQPISADSLSSLQDRAKQLVSGARITFVLTTIALLGMAAARYL